MQSLPQNLGAIKRMMGMVRSAGNPQAMLQEIASQNPKMRKALDIVQQSGGDPKAAFYKLAEEEGVNPDDIINALK